MEADAAVQQALRERDFARTRKNHERTKELETRFDEAQKDLDRKLQSWERTRRSSTAEVVVEDVAEIISRLTGVPVTELTQEERQRLLQMEQRLHQRVIGQDEAVNAVAEAGRLAPAGLKDRRRPPANFFFLRPNRVGKTPPGQA